MLEAGFVTALHPFATIRLFMVREQLLATGTAVLRSLGPLDPLPYKTLLASLVEPLIGLQKRRLDPAGAPLTVGLLTITTLRRQNVRRLGDGQNRGMALCARLGFSLPPSRLHCSSTTADSPFIS